MLKLNIITKDEYDTIISRLKQPKDICDYIWKDIIDGYFDKIVYPELTYLLDQYKLGNINREVLTNVANALCSVGEISTVGYVADVMCADAMKWVLNRI